jgi:chromatin segregation and condensation protein Rec8/ScpA/Scc1 (kleisin family)
MSFMTPKSLVKVAVEQAMRIENVIEKLLERVKTVQSVSLKTVTGSAGTEEEQKKLLIVNFIALLELLRVGSLHASQNADGGDITISSV